MMEFIIAERGKAVSALSLDQTGEPLRLAARAIFIQLALDDEWVVLIIEYKLYTLRNPHTADRIRETYNRLWDAIYAQLLRLSEHTGRSPDEIRTCLEVMRAVPPALLLEARLRLRPSQAMKERQVLTRKGLRRSLPGNSRFDIGDPQDVDLDASHRVLIHGSHLPPSAASGPSRRSNSSI